MKRTDVHKQRSQPWASGTRPAAHELLRSVFT